MNGFLVLAFFRELGQVECACGKAGAVVRHKRTITRFFPGVDTTLFHKLPDYRRKVPDESYALAHFQHCAVSNDVWDAQGPEFEHVAWTHGRFIRRHEPPGKGAPCGGFTAIEVCQRIVL